MLKWGRPPGLPWTGQEACPTKAARSAIPVPSVATVRTIGGRRPCAEAQHGLHLPLHAVGARLVGFVDDEDVGDLHDPGLDRLDVVAHARHQHHHGHLRQAGDLDFVLPDADGLDDHEVLARRVQQARQVGGGARQAAGGAAGRHGADEDAGIGVVLLHADAVAQDGAAGDAAAGIHREMPTVFPAARSARASASTSVLLPAPGGPVMPTTRGVAGERRSSRRDLEGFADRGSRCPWRRGPARARRPPRILRAHSFISFSGVAARSPAAGSRWCLRRWCRASRRGRTSPPDSL